MMKKFGFRLQNILRVREATRNEKQAVLAIALSELDAIQQEKTQLEIRHTTIQERVRVIKNDIPLNVQKLREAYEFLKVVKAELERASDRVSKADENVAQCREAMIVAEQAVKSIQLLRDRRYADHEIERQRSEAKITDELASNRYLRDSGTTF